MQAKYITRYRDNDRICGENSHEAIQIEAFGNPVEVVKAVDIRDVGAPAAGEVVIALEASPINQYDLLMIAGGYGYRPRLPAIMGTEGVGRAIAVGNAANDAVEQALSKTSLAELVRGVG
ncbi:MAG TPA: alcohol dehydrogenase catalytic domain-containing protein [Gemmatimonadales bacterium]|jgi:NADPH:quinone reductase-like Zn-dependent oxidoreductase|nr:alcohol dehydrogenase catalytic domain-containing protein [Gemmatimonadales bacterium]